MDRMIRLHVERLEEGGYVATSDDVQGLVAEAATIPELLELVPELVKMLDEIAVEYGQARSSGVPIPESFDMPVVLAA